MNDPARRPHPGWGWLCMALGLYPVAIATGWLPVDEADLHAPAWVLFLCGMVFVLCGAMILVGRQSRLNELLAALVLLAMGLAGAWVALFGADAGFAGGIPFLPRATNVWLARWVFAGGALLSFILSAWAVSRLLRSGRR